MSDKVQIAVRGVGGIICPLEVPCYLRCGVWAVTPHIALDHKPTRGLWRVTHVPSGSAVKATPEGWDGVIPTLREAKRLCRMLGERLPDFGARAKFGAIPTKTTSARWELGRAIRREWAGETSHAP